MTVPRVMKCLNCGKENDYRKVNSASGPFACNQCDFGIVEEKK